MPSTYSTDLKLELMVTGEKAGLWGNITNTNLNILQQAIGGYEAIALNATTGATLTFSNGTTSDGKNAVLDLTGTITTSVNVVIPDGIEKTYIVRNSTSGAHDVVVKTTTGTGATFNTTDKGFKLVYSDGTDVVDIGMVSETGVQTLTNKTLTSPKINEAVEVTATATELNILDGVTATTAELNYSDIVTLGTTAASKVFTADANNLTTVSGAVANVEDTLTDGATITWDVIDSPVAKVTLGGNRTLSAPSGTTPIAGQFISLTVIQDATGCKNY
jgi:hypothetical protein